ncbi:MAG: hypothetical protein ACR2GH_09045 [Pseudonocardia sp.]
MNTTQPTLPVSTPKGQIIVLGKEEDFLYIAPTVALMVNNIGLYLSGDSEVVSDPTMPQKGRLCLDELEFFDGAVRRLEPVVDAEGKLLNLIINLDYQVEVRARICRIIIAAAEMTQNGTDGTALADGSAAVPSDELGFDELLDRSMNDFGMAFNFRSSCTLWARWLGRC